MRTTSNQKYEITEISHEKYPFLHRIRALRDIGKKVKAGDLGGFVESESNLSFEAGDDAWIFGDAISCNDAYVDKGSALFGEAVACGNAYGNTAQKNEPTTGEYDILEAWINR